jgi:aminobenzoyl-glutamate utilization protein B
MIKKTILLIGAAVLAPFSLASAQDSDALIDFIDSRYEDTADIARTIWEFAEVGYQETQSSTL